MLNYLYLFWISSIRLMSTESEGIKGLRFIDYSFRSLEKFFKSNLIINIGRKKLQSENCLTLEDLGFSNDLINKKFNNPILFMVMVLNSIQIT